MFFKKKKEEKEGNHIPVMEARKMSATGMSDKEIIKNLKSEGYSYNQIEKAMLGAVKEGVSSAEELPPPPMPMQEPYGEEYLEGVPEELGFGEPAGPAYPEEEYPESFEPEPPSRAPASRMPPPSLEEYDEPEEAPEMLIEEVVEGVVEDKWQKFDKISANIDARINNIQDSLSRLEAKISSISTAVPHENYEARINEISDRIDDLQVRIGGLERAFKQILPSLTDNIENLSNIISKSKKQSNI